MSLFKSYKSWLYAAIAGAVMAYAAKHPEIPHDLVMVLLGVIAHALGVESGRNGTSKGC